MDLPLVVLAGPLPGLGELPPGALAGRPPGLVDLPPAALAGWPPGFVDLPLVALAGPPPGLVDLPLVALAGLRPGLVELPTGFVAWVVEPEVVFAFEPQVSVDIAVAVVVLVPVAVVVGAADSPGRPRFLAFPNVDHFASPSSSVAVVGWESAHSSSGARTSYCFYSILSNRDRHQNKNWEHCYNNPSPGYNNASDTSDLPIDATTSHSRKRCPHLIPGRRKCMCPAIQSSPAVRQRRLAAVEQC